MQSSEAWEKLSALSHISLPLTPACGSPSLGGLLYLGSVLGYGENSSDKDMYLCSSDLKAINMPRELVTMPLSMWDDGTEPGDSVLSQVVVQAAGLGTTL